MPRIQGMDADQRRRANRGIFSLATPFPSASRSNRSASAASNNEVDDEMDDAEFRICSQPEECPLLPTTPPAQNSGHSASSSKKEANNTRDTAAASEFLRCGGNDSAPLNEKKMNPTVDTEMMAPMPPHQKDDLKSPAASFSAENSTSHHCDMNSVRRGESPRAYTNSNGKPSAGNKTIPPRYLSHLQSNLANPNSWIDALKKQSNSASRQKGESDDRTNNANWKNQNHSNAYASVKGSIAISNLEESYFKKSTPNPGNNRSGLNSSSTLKSPQQTDFANKGGAKSSAMEVDDCLKLSAKEHQIDDPDNCPKVREKIDIPRQDSLVSGGVHNDDASSSKTDTDVARATEESKKLVEENLKAEAKYDADLKRAMEESKQQQSRHWVRASTATTEVVDLLDSDDDEDSKLSAVDSNSNQIDEDAQMKEAIQLSLEEAMNAKHHECRYSESLPRTCRTIDRVEFKSVVDAVVNTQGGYENIEDGPLIKHGNANDMKKSCVADGGGQNQTGAQYGRYSILSLWRLFDVLEGQAVTNIEDSDIRSKDADKLASDNGSKKELKREREKNSRLDGLPGAKIKAFVDIGHGMGIQVLQAGWSLGVPARGVEIMKDRHLIAQAIEREVLDNLGPDYPDATKVQLKHADFSRAILPDKTTNERDEELRKFLLFQDKLQEFQTGLVIFINNAEEVFAARSNQKNGGASLDSYLANLFAHMEIGGRMVTLTDVSPHLTQSSEWFRRDVFQSGTNAVSWGNSNKSVDVYVLTKLSNEWFCQNKKCEYKQIHRDGTAARNKVVEKGQLRENCVYCDAPAKRYARSRKPSAKRRRA